MKKIYTSILIAIFSLIMFSSYGQTPTLINEVDSKEFTNCNDSIADGNLTGSESFIIHVPNVRQVLLTTNKKTNGNSNRDITIYKELNNNISELVINYSDATTIYPEIINFSSGQASSTIRIDIAGHQNSTSNNDYVITWQGILDVEEDYNIPPTCIGGDNGKLILGVNNGSGTYSMQWESETAVNGFPNTILKEDLSSGTYSYSITDDNSCKFDSTAELLAPSYTLPISIAEIQKDCYDTDTAVAKVNVSGVGVYTYAWSDSKGILDSAINLNGGQTYYCTVNDVNSSECEILAIPLSSSNDEINYSFSTLTHPACVNENSGEIEILPAGGSNNGYEIKWFDNNSNSFSRTNLLAKDYSFIISDDNNCTISGSETLNNPTIGFTTNLKETQIDCYGDEDGEAEVEILTGMGAFDYDWSNSDNTINTSNLIGNTTYTCKITKTDGSGDCVYDTIVMSPVNPAINIVLDETDISCFGKNDGYIINSVTGGSGTLTYDWGSSITTQNRVNLDIGTYKVIVTDMELCKDSATVTLTEPDSLAIEAIVTDVTINGNNDGSILIDTVRYAIGDTTTFNYSWIGDNTTSGTGEYKQTELMQGIYNVTVSDDNGCEIADTFLVKQPDILDGGLIEFASNKDSVTFCYNYSNTLFSVLDKTSASGGKPSGLYSYDWEIKLGGSAWTSLSVNSDIPDSIFNLTITDDVRIRRIASDPYISANSNEIWIEYIEQTPLTILGLDDKYCQNDNESYELNGIPGNSNGTFSGLVVSDNADGTALYEPFAFNDTVVYGFEDTVTYTYTDNHGCISKKEAYTDVTPKPSGLSFDLPNILSRTDTTYKILGASPSGGTFTGNGVTADGEISFSNLSNTTYPYTYTVIENGCTNSVEESTTVVTGNGQFLSEAGGAALKTYFCFDGEKVIVYAEPANTPISHTGFIESYVSSDSLQYGSFIPKNMEADTYSLTYRYEITGQTLDITKQVIIDDVGNISIDDHTYTYCSYDVNDTISGKLDGVFNSEGTFYYSGGITDTDGLYNMNIPDYGKALFEPSQTSLGSKWLVYEYTSPTSLCVVKDSVTLTVYDPPTPAFTMEDVYNVNGPNDTLIGAPIGGTFYSSAYTLIDGIFDPTVLGAGTGKNPIVMNYEYTDPTTNCKSTVQQNASIEKVNGSIDGIIKDTLCYNEAIITLSISGLDNSNGSDGEFKGLGITSLTDNKASFDSKLAYDNSTLINNSIATIPISFQYLGTDNKTNFSIYDTIYIANSGTVEIQNLNDIKAYCSNADSVELIGIPANGAFISDAMIGNVFYPSLAEKDTVVITYSFNTGGCIVIAEEIVKINPEPSISIDLDNKCIEDSVEFFITSNTVPIEDIQSYTWSFFDTNQGEPSDVYYSDGATSDATPRVLYKSNGKRTITLKVTESTNGCQSTTSKPFVFEITPDANFTWQNECLNDEDISFFPEADSDTTNLIYVWDFGEGLKSSSFNPTYKYNSTGSYMVSFTASSKGSGCTNTREELISIRPTIIISEENGYFEGFENDESGWIGESLVRDSLFSWERGSSSISENAYEGNNIYATNLKGTYKPYEVSALTSPCFDFSELDRPMISMGIFTNLEEGRDGAVLQYALVDGTGNRVWNNIGSVNSGTGINWHNERGISGLSNISDGSEGWDIEDNNQWKTAKHYLDDIIGENNVRLRIAFGADGVQENLGIGIDGISIGNRKRIVVLEYFTNVNDSKSKTSDAELASISNSITSDFIDIHHHTSYPTEDPLYNDYPNGPSTRASYYNIESAPYAYMDGVISYDFQNTNPSVVSIKNQSLYDPLCDISTTTSLNGNKLSVNTKVTGRDKDSLVGRNLFLMTAVIETVVELDIKNQNIEFRNVLRQMLPSPGGEFLNGTWNEEYEYLSSLSYTIDDHINIANINVVSFVQDETTNEILQTAVVNESSIGTAIENLFVDGAKVGFIIYPNPANEQSTLVFNEAISSSDKLMILNQHGQILDQLEPTEGEVLKNINVSDYSDGIYYINWLHKGERIVNKLIITK